MNPFLLWYDYPTNYSNGSSVDGVADFFVGYPNYITNYWYGGGWMLFVWVFAFLVLLPFGARKSLLVSSLACFIFSTYLVMTGSAINILIPVTFIILTVIGGIGAMAEKNY